MFAINLPCLSLSSPKLPSSNRSEKPMTEFRGVRSSWLMVARNSLLVLFAASALIFASISSFSVFFMSVISMKLSMRVHGQID